MYRRSQPTKKNYTEVENDLRKLDQDIKAVVSKDLSKPLVVLHPVYDYSGRCYRLNIKSVQWEPDEVPSYAQTA